MKEISDYAEYVEKAIFILSSAYNAQYVRDPIEPKIKAYTDEELKQLIKLTRDLREAIFKNIDTHVLTIEHLADKELCQRRARERDNKAKVAHATNVPQGFTKVPVKSKMEQLFELMNKATPEQLEEALKNMKK